MIPGMGLKFLRDGMDSANFVAFNSVNGQNSYNFFEKDWSNHIPKAEGTALELASRKFLLISKFILTVGISNMATHTQDGTEEADVIFPWKLVFKPTGEFSWPSDKYPRPYTEYLKKDIPNGSKLFDVYAWDMPEELGGTETLIAEIVTGSKLYTSKWGDNNMRFRHQRMDDDLEYHPEWKPYVARQFGGDDLEDFGWQVDSEDLAVDGDENGRSLSASQHNRRLAEDIEDGYDVMMETGGFGCPFAFLL